MLPCKLHARVCEVGRGIEVFPSRLQDEWHCPHVVHLAVLCGVLGVEVVIAGLMALLGRCLNHLASQFDVINATRRQQTLNKDLVNETLRAVSYWSYHVLRTDK